MAVRTIISLDNFNSIVTSILGVGVGLCDSLKTMFMNPIPNVVMRNMTASIVTILPVYIVAVVPNAFIIILGFAGMILVIIAILLPVYLLYKVKINNLLS
ncbi:aromatic amino acid transport family protein [Rickettsia sibirica]|uniref:Tryptophan/tyrosine permease family protein n=1 Tax=Rickettsia sibirica (strain ATCC VR-151 / 246) TaxID=272951 RepID=Q7P8V6_RICS2|nr:aromatic amino acid transport family protein [Rickettsia sibirica]EAA26437.1 hypothetical protein rsib_orf1293 [Rickettsia sibirica 246]